MLSLPELLLLSHVLLVHLNLVVSLLSHSVLLSLHPLLSHLNLLFSPCLICMFLLLDLEQFFLRSFLDQFFVSQSGLVPLFQSFCRYQLALVVYFSKGFIHFAFKVFVPHVILLLFVLSPSGVVLVHTLYHFFFAVDLSYFLLMTLYMRLFNERIRYLILGQENRLSRLYPLHFTSRRQSRQHHHLFNLFLVFLLFNQLLQLIFIFLFFPRLLVELLPQHLMSAFDVRLDEPMVVLFVLKHYLLYFLLFHLFQLDVVFSQILPVFRICFLLLLEIVDRQILSAN